MIPLAITGLGMVCTVGHDVTTACGALRCGMSRPLPVEFEVPSDEEIGNEQLVGHPLIGISEGFHGLGLYLRLATHAITDLLHDSGLTAAEPVLWQRAALYAGLSPTRNPEIDFYDEILQESLVPGALRHTGLPLPSQLGYTVLRGHASVIWALREAAAAMERGDIERALIVGVDSLLETDVLEALYAEDRLKHASRARGLMPGEAAAALLVEPLRLALRRKASIRCLVEGLEVGQEPEPPGGPWRPGGNILAEVLARALGSATRLGAVYGDLNGEEWRSAEWGHALMRLRAAQHDLSPVPQHWLASSLGDTGAASGSISLVAAAHALSRGHAPQGDVLVWSRSDSGEVGAALLRRHAPTTPGGGLPGQQQGAVSI